MRVLTHEPDWISDDALHLRAFLQTPTGERLVQTLASRRPGFFSDEAGTESSFSRSRVIAGYELCLNELVGLSMPVPEPEKPPVNLPDLEDDTQWIKT